MKCILCEKNIDNYNSTFNHLEISENHAVDICQDCIDKFVKWQGKKYSILFPTKALKKKYGENK